MIIYFFSLFLFLSTLSFSLTLSLSHFFLSLLFLTLSPPLSLPLFLSLFLLSLSLFHIHLEQSRYLRQKLAETAALLSSDGIWEKTNKKEEGKKSAETERERPLFDSEKFTGEQWRTTTSGKF